MRIGLIVAMDKELTQLSQLINNRQEVPGGPYMFITGRVGMHDVIIMKCGIGKVNSTAGAVEMINRFMPEVIISTGCAGGARHNMEVGDVVVSSQCTYHDVYCGEDVRYGQFVGMPPAYDSDRGLLDRAMRLQGNKRIHSGLIVSGDWFVNSREKMGYILDRFPEAIAVDMESCSIAQVCFIYRVPFISFRVISDVPLSDNKAQQYYDFWDRMANGSFEVTRTFLNQL